ncbi:hypothetical protein ACFWCA_19000 [Streptomyces phaeochromogenes]|uniref:hypothetical protein n=1 Tax=Streptomyces phaeochromogenes TaxID=1923 RepID=UPI00368A5CD9
MMHDRIRVNSHQQPTTPGEILGADAWTVTAVLSGVLGNITAICVSIASLRRADAALVQAQGIAERTLAAEDQHAGTAACIAWREQWFALHDRGLNPAQIRRIMLLEPGGEGYEPGMGRIDDILRDIPRIPPSS